MHAFSLFANIFLIKENMTTNLSSITWQMNIPTAVHLEDYQIADHGT